MAGFNGAPPRGEAARYCPSCFGPLVSSDALTGLADRRAFRDRLEEALAQPEPPELAVMLLDLDRFKAVNDTLGHGAGDTLLRSVASRLQAALRKEDLPARLGGDEFAILVASPADEEAIRSIARRLVEMVSRPYLLQGGVANIGVSIGVAFAAAGVDADTLLRQADLALYKSKADGRGRFGFFEPSLQTAAEARQMLEFDLRAALPLGQFELFFQPTLQLGQNRLSGFEALIRWRHPRRGLVPPDGFLPMAEELGLIGPIGEWVLRQACAEAMRWPEALTVSVNVAARQFDGDLLVPAVKAALAASGLPGHRLELEVTEGALLRHGQGTLEQLRLLKAMGLQVSLDDFGTGYSSLTQLRSFPFDRVKIDRSFANDIAVVRAVAALGASLGILTTAEGVETEEQMRRLHEEGCTEAQGYLLSQPVPAAGVGELIDRFGRPEGAPEEQERVMA